MPLNLNGSFSCSVPIRKSSAGRHPAASHATSSSRDSTGVMSIWSRAMQRIPEGEVKGTGTIYERPVRRHRPLFHKILLQGGFREPGLDSAEGLIAASRALLRLAVNCDLDIRTGAGRENFAHARAPLRRSPARQCLPRASRSTDRAPPRRGPRDARRDRRSCHECHSAAPAIYFRPRWRDRRR